MRANESKRSGLKGWDADTVLGCVSGARSAARGQGKAPKQSSRRTILERALNGATKLAVGLLLFPQSAAAQGILEQFSYEGLRFSGVGIEVGVIDPDRLISTFTGAVRVDYGFIAPRIRLLLGVSYFDGDFDPSEIAEFEASLREVVTDPTDDFTIDVGTVSWSDVQADVDLQYVIPVGERAALFAGLGFAAHFRNGSGAAIDGTFVEDALDTVGAGINASLGGHFPIIPAVFGTVHVRGGISSDLLTLAARVGLMYRVPR